MRSHRKLSLDIQGHDYQKITVPVVPILECSFQLVQLDHDLFLKCDGGTSRMNARTTSTLIRTACRLLSTLAAMIAPGSVKTHGRYLMFSPHLPLFRQPSDETKILRRSFPIALDVLVEHPRLGAMNFGEIRRENDPLGLSGRGSSFRRSGFASGHSFYSLCREGYRYFQ